MNIYIDESGSFVSTPKGNSWSVVAALAIPENEEGRLSECLAALKRKNGADPGCEFKIHKMSEESYVRFLEEVGALNVAIFATAFDAGLGSVDSTLGHQQNQVKEVLRHLGEMKYEGGREGLKLMAAQLAKLPPQLYAQLFCQVHLMYETVGRAILYFVQRTPETLSAFRWRVDRKNPTRTDYEDVFEKISPVLLQTMSIRDPLAMVRGFDYSSLARYYGEVPEYLREVLGDERKEALDVQKIIREDIQFVDSKESPGVQAVDLVVSGIAGCLRRKFTDNERMAALLGKLMVQAKHNAPPLNLITFATGKHKLERGTAQLVRILIGNCKNMLVPR